MSNKFGTRASREEEIAFLVMEKALGVEIALADSIGVDSMPDGSWATIDGHVRGIVEVTSPPCAEEMNAYVQNLRKGTPYFESYSGDICLNALTDFINAMFHEKWAVENTKKLQGHNTDERHLYLFGRDLGSQSCFNRLSDEYKSGPIEAITALNLPDGITDAWFQGRARQDPEEQPARFELRVARFQRSVGWQVYAVIIHESQLPMPSFGVYKNLIPPEMRQPKNRVPD